MSPPPIPLQNHFLFSPRRPSAQNPQAELLIKIQKETQSHKRPHQKQAKKQFQHHRSQKSKAKPSKRQSKTVHQTPPTRKYTHPNSHPNPTNILPNPTQKPYTPKRKDVFLQTQVHFTPNAEEFAPKRFGVSSKTQGRLTTNASPFSAPKSPDNSPSYLPKRPKIPKNKKPLPPDSPKPLHFAPSHPLQRPSERGFLSKLPRKSPQKQNQKDTQITTQAAKRNQTVQIEINPEIRYKAQDSPRSKPSFFPSPSYKMHEKVCSFHKK